MGEWGISEESFNSGVFRDIVVVANQNLTLFS